MDRPLLTVPVSPTDPPQTTRLTDLLTAAIRGEGPAIAPVPAGDGTTTSTPAPPPVRELPPPVRHVPEQVALVVATSGSTGRPRQVMLDTAALRASADATHEHLSGPGRWVLTLPLTHIAGLQVLLRSIAAGTRPAVLSTGGFDPARLAEVTAEVTADVRDDLPLYTSLVPTQLHRVVAAVDGGTRLPSTLAVLGRFDAILVGGATTGDHLLDRARDLGLRVVTTYGMTETCGGCVYDGRPLRGVRVDVRDDGVRLAGPVLARGYLPSEGRATDDAAFVTDPDGTRWFRTRDHGVAEPADDGTVRLRVTGRVDDVLVTGGVKVSPQAVERVLATDRWVDQVCVVGVPDAEWGQAVTAVVVPRPDAPTVTGSWLGRLRDVVGRSLGTAAAPRHLVLVDALPVRGPGKTDRAEVTRRAVARLRPPAPPPV